MPPQKEMTATLKTNRNPLYYVLNSQLNALESPNRLLHMHFTWKSIEKTQEIRLEKKKKLCIKQERDDK